MAEFMKNQGNTRVMILSCSREKNYKKFGTSPKLFKD